MTETLAADIVNGAYWMRRPGPNAQVVIIYQGVVAPEAMSAAGLLGEDRRDIGVLAVTSADRLNAGWQAAERARQRGAVNAMSHVERLLAPLSRECGLVTVIDGHPAALSWIGGVYGHRVKSLGVEHFGQTGSIEDLYRHYGIDANAIAHAAQAVGGSRPRSSPSGIAVMEYGRAGIRHLANGSTSHCAQQFNSEPSQSVRCVGDVVLPRQ